MAVEASKNYIYTLAFFLDRKDTSVYNDAGERLTQENVT